MDMYRDLALMMAIWWGPVIALAIIVAARSRQSLRWPWLIGALVLYLGYTTILFAGWSIPGLGSLFEGSQFNWSGKITAVLFSSAVLAGILAANRHLSLADFGVTLRLKKGWLLPSVLTIAFMIAFIIGLQMLANDGPSYTPDALAYQATMPGLDEELLFRGLLLTMLALALGGKADGRDQTLYPGLWPAILVTLLFTLGHCLFVTGGAVSFDPISCFYVAILGIALVYLRLRSGSIVLPLIAHNATNVTNLFF